MKYLVVTDTGGDVFIEEFDTLSEANVHGWHTYHRYQSLPRHCPDRKYHVFVATPRDDGDMDIEDNYFDSKILSFTN